MYLLFVVMFSIVHVADLTPVKSLILPDKRGSNAVFDDTSIEHLFLRGVSCADIAAKTRTDILKNACYSDRFREKCNSICQEFYTGNSECPYGDKNPNYCRANEAKAAEKCPETNSVFYKNCCDRCILQAEKRILQEILTFME